MTAPGLPATGAGGNVSDVRAEVLRAAEALSRPGLSATGTGVTSDLSIDETLLLHSVAWEPTDLVFGSSMVSVPYGVWTWGQGEIGAASAAYAMAFAKASERLVEQCSKAGGHGIVGVEVDVEVHPRHIDVTLVGTAIRPTNGQGSPIPFASDLSARDFALLDRAGWKPVSLSFGASFVYAPRRTMGTTIAQKRQNVELTNFTEAMYSAREQAMARMQDNALRVSATGIVAVNVTEGPVRFASHAVGFTAWGTAIKPSGEAHKQLLPTVVVSLDDRSTMFDAASLRG